MTGRAYMGEVLQVNVQNKSLKINFRTFWFSHQRAHAHVALKVTEVTWVTNVTNVTEVTVTEVTTVVVGYLCY